MSDMANHANARNLEVRLAKVETQLESNRFPGKVIGWIFAGIATFATALLIGVLAWLSVEVYEIKATQVEMRATQTEIKATVDRIEVHLAE